jgi:hypothetical protein
MMFEGEVDVTRIEEVLDKEVIDGSMCVLIKWKPGTEKNETNWVSLEKIGNFASAMNAALMDKADDENTTLKIRLKKTRGRPPRYIRMLETVLNDIKANTMKVEVNRRGVELYKEYLRVRQYVDGVKQYQVKGEVYDVIGVNGFMPVAGSIYLNAYLKNLDPAKPDILSVVFSVQEAMQVNHKAVLDYVASLMKI